MSWLNWIYSYDPTQLGLSGYFSLIPHSLFLLIIYIPVFSPSPPPPLGGVMKEAPNHIPMNMIGSAHNARKILKDDDIWIVLVVLINPTRKVHPKATCRS